MSSTDRTRSTEIVAGKTPGGPGCKLIVIDGVDRGQVCDLVAGRVVVGKSSSADMRLTDASVSGRHVSFEVTPNGVRVHDLGSTNGTVYLGERVTAAVLTAGAVVTIGKTRLAVTSREPHVGKDYSARDSYGELLGSSVAMRRLYALLERIEDTDYTVLIEGETGVGKDLVAREIHAHSKRKRGRFAVFDCGSVSAELVESELFGHVRGAFSGAERARDGLFVYADTGTVFLDEIGELRLDLQPKLLRVLETREVRVVGSDRVRRVDARIIAATHRDLADEVRLGRFREDLYFRLNVVRVAVPPLRERREDIPPLVKHFAVAHGLDELAVSTSTLELFTSSYDWPGNVRELRNAITRVGALGVLPEPLRGTRSKANPDEPFDEAKKKLITAFERDYFTSQLTRHGNNIARAARAAGVDRAYFRRMLQRHGLLPKV